MYGVLIVDDDAYIRKGLIQSVNWEEYGFEVVGEAANGKDALALLCTLKPSLIISDIRMPVMTGIEMMTQLRQIYPEIKVVMISAYSDFDYVKESMELGARSYILKPLNKEDMIEVIKSLAEELEAEQRDKKKMVESITALRYNVINRMLANEISSSELQLKLALLDIQFEEAQLQVVIIKVKSEESDSFVDIEDLKSYVSKRLSTVYDFALSIEGRDRINLIFYCHEQEILKSNIKETMKALAHKIQINCGLDIFVASGNPVDSYKQISSSYKEALNGLQLRMIYGPNTVIFYEDINQIYRHHSEGVSIDREALRSLLISYDIEGLGNYLDMIYVNELSDTNVSPDQIILATIELLSVINSVIKVKDQYREDYGGESLVNTILKMDSIMSLRQWLMDRVVYVVDLLKEEDTYPYSDNVKEIIQHISKHYSEPGLSLKVLAAKLEVSATYLGRSFKAETDQYFSDYLNHIRIEYAKGLLETTSLSSKEIAQKVGFDNVNYFYTVFKKNNRLQKQCI